MPKYRNTSPVRADLRGVMVGPGDTVDTVIYPDPLPSAFVLVTAAPMWNSVLVSEKVTSSKTINIPTGEIRFNIHFFVKTGDVNIYFNDVSNTPALLLYEGAHWNVKCFDRTVDSIVISMTSGSVLYVIVEAI